MKAIKENWKLVLIVAAGIIAVIFMCIFGVQGAQNKAFALEEQVNTADSDIKVQEKRRVDLVYNLADCVKQYDKHEAETLTAIVEGREKATSIENVTTAIAAVTEAYPELKSNENYKELMNELSITELKRGCTTNKRRSYVHDLLDIDNKLCTAGFTTNLIKGR